MLLQSGLLAVAQGHCGQSWSSWFIVGGRVNLRRSLQLRLLWQLEELTSLVPKLTMRDQGGSLLIRLCLLPCFSLPPTALEAMIPSRLRSVAVLRT